MFTPINAQKGRPDRRQDKNYREYDEERQSLPASGHTREDMAFHERSPSPLRVDTELFVGDTSRNVHPPASERVDVPRMPGVRQSLKRKHESVRDSEASEDINGPCTCPVDYNCAPRRPDELDCRPLVPNQWKQFQDRMDEEAYMVQKTDERLAQHGTASYNKLDEIHNLLNIIQYAPLNPSGVKQTAFRSLQQWILCMHTHDVQQHDLDATRILPHIKAFISPHNAQTRRQMLVNDCFVEELTILYRKWDKGDLLCDPNRGLVTGNVNDTNGTTYHSAYVLDKDWQFYTDARYFGAGELVNGQVWYSRQQLMRDGVHASRIGGIAGTAKHGAYSVVMGLHTKNNKYADVDMKYLIEYEGTARTFTKTSATNIKDADQDTRPVDNGDGPTSATQALMKSLQTGTPVRVIRSFKLAPIVDNKPRKGYRYDGLYKVESYVLQKEKEQIYSFRMRRIAGQGQLRGTRPEDDPANNTNVRRNAGLGHADPSRAVPTTNASSSHGYSHGYAPTAPNPRPRGRNGWSNTRVTRR